MRILTIVPLLLTTFITMAQSPSKEVPPSVQQVFSTQYPQAKKVRWQQHQGHYTASFRLDRKRWEAQYDEQGQALSSEVALHPSELPQSILLALEAELPGYRIKEVEKVSPTTSSPYYVMEIEQGDLSYKIEASDIEKSFRKQARKRN